MSTVGRFLVAYLGAAAVAAAIVLVQSAQMLAEGLGPEPFRLLMDMALIYGLFSLVFTFFLGFPTWLVLKTAGWNNALLYAVVGSLLGFAGASLFTHDLRSDHPFLYSFPVAGLAAALTFRWLFYRRPYRQALPDAAA